MNVNINTLVVLLGVLFGFAGAFAYGVCGIKMPTNRQIATAVGYWSLLLLVVFAASFVASKTPVTKEGFLSWLPLMVGAYGVLVTYAVGLLIAKRL